MVDQQKLAGAAHGEEPAVPKDSVDAFAAVALGNITRPYPYAAHHVQADVADLLAPGQRHPAFANSFDWHSSVHMHWLLTQIRE